MNDRTQVQRPRATISPAPAIARPMPPAARGAYRGTFRHNIANIAFDAASSNHVPEAVIQAKVGEIFMTKFVIEAGTGEVYHIEVNERAQFADRTAVTFDLTDAQTATNLQQGLSTVTRDERAHNYVQISAKSCAIEVVRMMYHLVTGQALERTDAREMFNAFEAYEPNLGADISGIPRVLEAFFHDYAQANWRRRFKPPSIAYRRNVTVSLLAISVPAIAILANPNHVVVVDRVTGDIPNRNIEYRDPDHGSNVVASEAQFALRATGSYFVLR